MKMIQCSSCFKQLCVGGGSQEEDFCPVSRYPEIFDEAKRTYAEDSQTRLMAKTAAMMESKGYIVWPRLKDVIEFSKNMKCEKMAVLFCPDLWKETKKACTIFSEHGFGVSSRVCGIGKSNPQTPDEFMSEINDGNPDIIINAGLCIPFEAQVLRLSKVPVSTFIARDKKLNNYPALAVYSSDEWRDWSKEVYREKLGLK
jgi:uncharacterized metal-binding protein